MVLVACSKRQFDEVPHTRCVSKGGNTIKIDTATRIVGFQKGKKECSLGMYHTVREAVAVFEWLISNS